MPWVSGSPRGWSLVRAASLAAVALMACATSAQAQDVSVVGDWRFIGQSDEDGFGWNATDVRRDGSQATVSILQTPLAGGRYHHRITQVVVDCAARTYRIIGVTDYDAEGLAPPSMSQNDGPFPLAGPPSGVEGPVCRGEPALTPGAPVSASVFSTGLREYINSGAAAWADPRLRR